jgi:hypothetical protein
MVDPVLVQVPLNLLREIRAALNMCGKDLASELNDRYPEKQRETYPTYLRRWNNDMEPVRNTQQLCVAIDNLVLT